VVALLTDIPRVGTFPPRLVAVGDDGLLPRPGRAPSVVGDRRSPTVGPDTAVVGCVAPSQRALRPSCRPSPAVLRRRRTVAVVLVAALAVCSWIGLQAALGRIGGGPLATTDAPGGLQSAAARVWIVRPGDTLWSIAQVVDPVGDERPLVDRLAAETGTTALYPGETIGIPSS